MKNSIFFFIGLITLFASCTPDTVQDIEPVEYDVDIPFNPNAENDLPSDTGGFIGSISVGDGFNIKLDTMINDIPSDVGGFNSISNFQAYQYNGTLGVSFDAVDDINDFYTFIVYDWANQNTITGFRLRGGAESYSYELHDLPTGKDLIIWGWMNRGFGNEYLGGVWVNINSNN